MQFAGKVLELLLALIPPPLLPVVLSQRLELWASLPPLLLLELTFILRVLRLMPADESLPQLLEPTPHPSPA
jgi:hypothetical protein